MTTGAEIDLGKLSVLPAEGDARMAGASDDTLNAADDEVRRITDECYARRPQTGIGAPVIAPRGVASKIKEKSGA